MTAYYNEFEAYPAQWLRNLSSSGHIARGTVDERSIEDITPSELDGFTQHHFFAGIGVWSYALRLAGWPDELQAWTGSCPCQPFSSAGKGAGFADERHLWPAWFHLIEQCRPAIVFGEQVASGDAGRWLDLVQSDLEALGYAFGCLAFPAASVGAPHIRDRAYWVAYANNKGLERWQGAAARPDKLPAGERGVVKRMAHSDRLACEQGRSIHGGRSEGGHEEAWAGLGGSVLPDALAIADCAGQQQGREASSAPGHGEAAESDRSDSGSGPTNGVWRDADWLFCRDGKWRPVEPGLEPLVDVPASRVGRLRAYGNAIVAEQAAAFIRIVMARLS